MAEPALVCAPAARLILCSASANSAVASHPAVQPPQDRANKPPCGCSLAVAMSVARRRPHARQLQALAWTGSAAAGLDYQRTAATDEYNTMRAFSRMTGCGVEC